MVADTSVTIGFCPRIAQTRRFHCPRAVIFVDQAEQTEKEYR